MGLKSNRIIRTLFSATTFFVLLFFAINTASAYFVYQSSPLLFSLITIAVMFSCSAYALRHIWRGTPTTGHLLIAFMPMFVFLISSFAYFESLPPEKEKVEQYDELLAKYGDELKDFPQDYESFADLYDDDYAFIVKKNGKAVVRHDGKFYVMDEVK